MGQVFPLFDQSLTHHQAQYNLYTQFHYHFDFSKDFLSKMIYVIASLMCNALPFQIFKLLEIKKGSFKKQHVLRPEKKKIQ